MSEPVWLDPAAVRLLHGELMSRYACSGEQPGDFLESALAEVRRQSQGDLADHAAAYMCVVTAAKPFAQGNEAAVLLSALLFLDLNGHTLRASQAETVAVVSGLSSGLMSRSKLASWLREHLEGVDAT